MESSGGNAHSGDVPLLVVERSGGTASRFARLRVDASGVASVRRPPRPEVSIQMDPDRLARVRSLITGAHFRSLAASYFLPQPAVAGGYAWRITHAGTTVATRDGEAPRGLGVLMRELAAFLDEVAFDDEADLSQPSAPSPS